MLETHLWVVASMVKPERQAVQALMLPEHWAQLELQETHLPLMAVKPFWQLATQLPLEMMPEAHTHTPERGVAPTGQVVWHLPWKK